MTDYSQIATIVLPSRGNAEVQPTAGTRVRLVDGSELHGVTGITLRAGINDVWRADIECLVHVKGLDTVAAKVEVHGRPMTWWRRALLRLAGIEAIKVTTIEDRAWDRYLVP